MAVQRVQFYSAIAGLLLLLIVSGCTSVHVDGERITYSYGPRIYLLPCVTALVIGALGYLFWRFQIVSPIGYWIFRTRYSQDDFERYYRSPKFKRIYFRILIALTAAAALLSTVIAIVKSRQSIVVSPEQVEFHYFSGGLGDGPGDITILFSEVDAMELKKIEIGTTTRPKTGELFVWYSKDGSHHEIPVDDTPFEAARNSIREAALNQGVDVRFPKIRYVLPP